MTDADPQINAEIVKLQRDRKLLRRLDVEIAQHTLPSVVGYLLVYAVLIFAGDLYANYPKLTIVSGVILMLLGVLRLAMLIRFDVHYARGPARWRREFITVYQSNAIVWSALQAHVISFYGMSVDTFLMVTFTTSLCSVSNVTWKSNGQVSKTYLAITLLPATVAFVMLNTVYSYLFALMLMALFVALWKQAVFLHTRYWEETHRANTITHQVRDLESAMASAEQERDVKIDFLNNLTHDIRTPMNSVLGMLSLLGDTELKEDQKEFQTVATHAGESLLTLIDDILDYSKISSGKFILDSTVFNLRKCVDDTLETLGPVAHQRGVELSCVYDKGIPTRVRGDGPRISQIVQNLVTNAIKFSDGGEVVVEVHLKTVGQSEGLLRVHVSDQGIGVPEDMKEKIFDVFSTADSSSTRKHSGTGLGLAISKGLVECMNGKISLFSKEGEGSTFWFSMMVRLSSQQAQHSNNYRALAGKKVLIVDAPAGLIRGLSNGLESWEMEVESIEGYDKALQVLRTTAREGCGYDLVMLNMGLKYQGSFKLSRIIQEDPILKDTKQLILSTLIQRGSSGALKHAEQVKNVLFLTKPATRSSLYSALCTLYGVEKVVRNTPKKLIEKKPMNPYKVLLVEDNKVNQMVAKGMLTRLGYGVKIVNNGKEALGILADKSFDLILMDCHMPELDGYETTHEIRERENGSDTRIPIVAMTANAMDGDEARCLASGMDDYLSKPVNVDELDSKLRLWLGQRLVRDGIIRTDTSAGDPPNSQIH
ncbi:MAG: response regulator [Pseudomonadales bacterium]|nr:response regulator [Pseudomonadales bacterium]